MGGELLWVGTDGKETLLEREAEGFHTISARALSRCAHCGQGVDREAKSPVERGHVRHHHHQSPSLGRAGVVRAGVVFLAVANYLIVAVPSRVETVTCHAS